MALFKKKVKTDEDYFLASQWTLMGRKLVKHKLAVFSMWLLGILYFCALFANFLAPYGLEEYDSVYKNAAPTKVRFVHEGEFIGPYVYKVEWVKNKKTFKTEFKEITDQPYKIKLFEKGCEYKGFRLQGSIFFN